MTVTVVPVPEGGVAVGGTVVVVATGMGVRVAVGVATGGRVGVAVGAGVPVGVGVTVGSTEENQLFVDTVLEFFGVKK